MEFIKKWDNAASQGKDLINWYFKYYSRLQKMFLLSLFN